MIHRRLLHDDAFGVGEALNEAGVGQHGLVVRGSHYILSGINSKTCKNYFWKVWRSLFHSKNFLAPTLVAEERKIAAQNILSPLLFVAGPTATSYSPESNIEDLLKKVHLII